ncbi:MAG: hypothetical protein AAF566_13250 [Pseudomonadota bacterium]
MQNMFDNPRPDPQAVDRVKAYFVTHFGLSETTLLSIAELRCHEPDCPPIETVVTARGPEGSVRDWRLGKPIKDITDKDVEALGEH